VTAFATVIPVIDEREAIGDIVAGLRRSGACCVFVVDGGSVDGTAEVATKAGAIVIDEPRRGYGQACLTGAARALGPGPHRHDAVAFLDGDGSCDPAEIERLVGALSTAEVALGRRVARRIEPGAMPWHARLGNHFVALILSIRTGRRVHDLPPAKAIRPAAMERLALDETGFGWTVEFVARALSDRSLRILEIPVSFRPRRGGVSKVSGSPRASARAALAMIRVAIQATRPRPVMAMMAKAPGSGQAKTRLAVDLGAGSTAEFWAACLADSGMNLLKAALVAEMDPIVMLAGSSGRPAVAELLDPRWAMVVQGQPGLSEALIDVFLGAYDRGTDRAIAVAGDVPSLPPAYTVDALARLGDGPMAAVLGPSRDGGYHVVALRWTGTPRWWPRSVRRRRRAHLAGRLRTAFHIPMGGATALEATTRGLVAAGWTVSMLEPWTDIDTIDDLRTLAADLEGDGRHAPRTSAWLANHDVAPSRR
jgi:glycosyltransferase A (GT-A) superfamily protein (DUF2064 family)